MNYKCPHITKELSKFSDVKNIKESCENCESSGPNLWVCMYRNCFRVGCSEQLNDHSTKHFENNYSHCVHMNLSSQRLWCYICENEVFLRNDSVSLINNPFDSAECGSYKIGSQPNENKDNDTQNVQGLVGLQNLANTCYMNSALQALSNIQPLTSYFLDCADLIEHTAENMSCNKKSGLAKNYMRLIKEIWCRKNKTKDYIAPRGILYGIRTVNPMFRGFQQHDTQEFLRCFMDQLHEELKELCPQMPFENISNHKNSFSSRNPNHKRLINDVDSLSHSDSDSTSQSEAEYETCDSGVSEQSSSFDDSLVSENTFIDQMYLPDGNASLNKQDFLRQKTNQREKYEVELRNGQNDSLHRSIISEIFDGKLLSSVQCLTCDRISSREETFQDLSLPIPNKDYLHVLHQSHSINAQSINSMSYGLRVGSTLSTEYLKNDGWLTWMWNIFRSWLWGPSITLYDCMASFFSADELKGDNMYSCDKCNKLRTGIKYSRILNLPEALCIHLKRFRHDLSYSSKISSFINFPMECFDMGPYLHKECKSNVSLYNLVSVICHYGTVGGGHYTCFAKNEITNKWYEFDDQHVTEVGVDTVQNAQAYVLFYRKRNPQMDLIRMEARDICNTNHISDIRFYVSREWITRFNTFAEPGPINNWAILCPHGGLPPYKIEVMNKIAVPISQQLWDYLYNKFGGGPAINMLFECEICKRSANNLMRRQKYELAVFMKYNDVNDGNAIYAISMPWLRKWQLFARGLTNKEPGSITNSTIAASTDGCSNPTIKNVISGSDYAQLNEHFWKFLYDIYGGGPEILLRENINAEVENISEPDYDNIRIQKLCADVDYSSVQDNMDNSLLNINSHLDECHSKRNGKCFTETLSDELKSVDTTSYDFKQSKSVSTLNKKLNIISVHDPSNKNKNKKIKRSRNSLKNSGFFGLSGNYICNQIDDRSNIQLQEETQTISESFQMPTLSNDKGDMAHSRFTSSNKISTEKCKKQSHRRSKKKRKVKEYNRLSLKKSEEKSSESYESEV